ncbi:cobyrinate a,c-diamide synthase [Deferribacteraceae bacterium V6Fe1]|nr:cobyrinate a,c-diamide synthase [Deferribacteraceae bacterium V6Fe1]
MIKKAVLIASDKSGSGKSLFTLFLSRYFSGNHKAVLPFKCGPDYIDTLHLKYATGNNAYNLDTILVSPDRVKSIFLSNLNKSDIAVIEGVMGFYDGIDYKTFSGSTYEIAKLLNVPIILVLDVSSTSFTVAARVNGLINLGENINVAGVILNNVGSKRHEKMLTDAIEYHTGIKVFGAIPKLQNLNLSSRHLGIYTALETKESFYDEIVDTFLNYVDVNQIYENINYNCEKVSLFGASQIKKDKKAYIAFDEAFNFYYQDNIDFLEENGYQIINFSPLKNELPENPDFIYFGGGYPELFAEKLSNNKELKAYIRKVSKQGIPIFAECGGMMFLSKGVQVGDNFFEMCNVFNVTVEMTDKRQALGYIKATALKKTNFFDKADCFVGHEFHYSKVKDCLEEYVFKITKLTSGEEYRDGFVNNNTLACYTHFHFLSDNCIIKKIIRR